MKITQLPVTSKPAAMEWLRAHRLTGLGILQWLHDDDCPALKTHQDADCCAPCVPDILLIEPFVESPMEDKAVLN